MEESAAGPTFRVTDTLGVQVVTALRPLPVTVRNLTAASHLLWRTGWRDREPWFNGVTTGYLLADGGAVVADGATREIRVITSRGEVDAVIGYRGNRRRRFQSIDAVLHLPPDSILVVDGVSRRVSVYSRFGLLGRSFPLPAIGRYGYLPEAVVNDRLLHLPYASFSSARRAWRPVDGPVLSTDLRGEDPDTLFMPERPSFWQGGERFPGVYPRHAIFGAHSEGWVWASNVGIAIDWYAPEGTLLRILRAEAPQGQVTGPAFSKLIVGQNGSVWRALDFTWGRIRTWSVVEGAGATAYRVRVPDRFRVLDVTADHVLGVWNDEEGVQAVAALSIAPRTLIDRLRSLLRW